MLVIEFDTSTALVSSLKQYIEYYGETYYVHTWLDTDNYGYYDKNFDRNNWTIESNFSDKVEGTLDKKLEYCDVRNGHNID